MHRQTLINFFLVLLSVVGYALAMPCFNLWGFCFICLIPFFFVLDQADSMLETFLYGLIWGTGLAVSLGYWAFIAVLHYYEVPLAKSLLFFSLCVIVPIAGLYGFFALIYRFFNCNSLFFYALMIPSVWILLEYTKAVLPFLIPWGGMDCALIGFSEFVQIVDIIGAYGVIWIAVAVNALVLFCLKNILIFYRNRQRPALSMAGLCFFISVLLIGLPGIYGRHQLQSIRKSVNTRMETPDHLIRATLVQGSFSTKERWSGMGFYQRVLRYLEISEDKGQGAPRRVIVWPENTLNVSSKIDDALFIELMRGIGENALLIAGGLKDDVNTGEVFNSAYFISGAGRLRRYDKQILLPYSETSPLIDLLDAYYTAPSEFAIGKTSLCVASSPGPAGPSICFEILYSGRIRQSVREGARYLVNLSNDSWFGESPMPWVHLNAARLRAIENRRFLLRAATSGISAIIGPDGQTVAKSRLFVQERVDADFVTLDDLSFYTQYGDWILFAAAGIIFFALVQVVARNEAADS